MKTILTLFLCLVCFSASAQKTKEKPVLVFQETLRPSTGMQEGDNPAYSESRRLKKDYGIEFHCSKINDLDSGSCVFSTTENDEALSASLNINDKFYDLISKNKKYRIEAQYIKYLPNLIRPNYSEIILKFSVYRNRK